MESKNPFLDDPNYGDYYDDLDFCDEIKLDSTLINKADPNFKHEDLWYSK